MAITIEQLGADVKKKYPQYSHLSDTQLGEMTLKKYPEYQSVVSGSSTSQAGVSSPTASPVTSPSKVASTQKPIFKTLGESLQKRGGQIKEAYRKEKEGEIGGFRSLLRGAGAVAGGIGDVVGAGLSGVFRALPNEVEDPLRKVGASAISSKTGQSILAPIQKGAETYSQLEQSHPELAKDIGAVGSIASLIPIGKGIAIAKGGIETGLKKVAKQGVKNITKDVAKVVPNTAKSVLGSFPTPKGVSGVTEIAREQIGKIPRGVRKLNTRLKESAEKRAAMKISTPEVKKALEVNLKEDLIDMVQKADRPTSKNYQEMIDIVKSKSKTTRPDIIAGNVPTNQYKLLEKEIKNVGSKIGEQVDRLPVDYKIDIQPAINKVKGIIQKNDISLSEAERNQVNQLIKEATQHGTELTPKQIYAKNKIFGKLQREARFNGLGNIIVETLDGDKKDIFSLLRDVFYDELDSVSPQIKKLNKQYKDVIDLREGVEKKVFSGMGKVEAQGVDIAEVAQTRLRSLLSDNQNRPFLQNMIDQLDAKARELGYNGAKAYDLIDFASELRTLYPEIIPKESFTGILSRKGIGNAIGTIADYGTPGLKDQQQALEELLKVITKKNALNGLKKP